MTIRLDDFKAALADGGARSNLFRCTISWPNSQIAGEADRKFGGDALHSFMIKTASLPGSTIASIPVPFRGRTLKVSGDREFADWTVSVTNDNNFAVRNAFEAWHDSMSGAATAAPGARGVSTHHFDQYAATIDIEQLDRKGNSIKTYKLIGAWPTEVSAIDVSYDAGDIEEFTVNFAFQWFESQTTSVPTRGGFSTPPTVGGAS